MATRVRAALSWTTVVPLAAPLVLFFSRWRKPPGVVLLAGFLFLAVNP